MPDIKDIIQSQLFAKQKKKLHENQLKDLDNAVKTIVENPDIGDITAGDLRGIHVYKFNSLNSQMLIAYEVVLNALYLYAFGSHENFYRDLKKHPH